MAYEEVLKDLDRQEKEIDKILEEIKRIREKHDKRVKGTKK